ncbi:MAG TPA: hydantoinase/oxoprolinase N-terminal domain-containing protein [Pseudonocardia sp.]|nr:hydantoinase/oxoprolinase N-terminal domain-containing protein [Pseudonocardia sp.]
MSRRVGVALDEFRAVAVLIDDIDVVLAQHTVGFADAPAAGEPADRGRAGPEPVGPEPVGPAPVGPEPTRAPRLDLVVRSMCRMRHIPADFVPDPVHHIGHLTDLLREVLTGLADTVALGGVERVVIATSAPVDLLDTPAALRPVGVLRIGAPATTSIPPLTGWPRPLAEAVRGPVAVVGGGHLYDGREFAPLDLAAVRAFGEACRGTVRAVAVTGADAHMNPEHEERARAVLTELLGPDTPVVTSHDVGGAGLLERENTVVLGAAVAPAIQRFTDDAVAALAALGVGTGAGADLYLVTGDGTVLPAGQAVRHPLALLGAVHGAQVAGAPVEAGLYSEVAGVRTSIRPLRPAEAPSGAAGALAAAVGAATGEASGTVDRVYFYGDGGREECVATARRSARELAIRRGADPRTVRVGEVREGAMTYVPLRCVRLRVTATGPVMATGGHPEGDPR